MCVSVIIPTYNRNKMLCDTISNIIRFEHQYNELVIVDQTKEHDSETRLFLDNLLKNKKIKYIYVDYPNLPNARNVGINNSIGDIIIFFDDDVEINENTIPSHIASLSEPEVGCVTGRVTITNTNKNKNIVLSSDNRLKKIIKSFFFFFLRNKASYVGLIGVLSDFSCDKLLPADTCIGCNMSFKRNVLLKCGLFDSNYTGNAVREDTDMSVRIRKNKYKIIYNPTASIIHFMDNSGGTRTSNNDIYWYIRFKNQCYFYLKNFKYFYKYIYILHIFDFIRCKKNKLKYFSIFKNSYNDAKRLLK